ncbi:MAG TPA: aldehyde dehydrogenase family protein [Streptosporangiaceae bacterium]|jgi:benzaldehyde dehydrogenase (NAD)
MELLDPGRWTGRVLSGTWRVPHGGALPITAPATGATIGTAGRADATDIADATARAAAAQPAWAATGPRDRAAVLDRAAAVLDTYRAEIVAWSMRETGAVRAKAAHEIGLAIGELRAASALATGSQGELLPGVDAAQYGMARRVPIGVAGVIAPWNAPLMLGIRAVAPALALGNAVVLKPDPQTPVTGGFVLALALAEAGLPSDVLHVLPGGADAGEALVASPHTSVLSFTGSTAAGRRVGAVAGGLLKRVVLELGGNNAHIVLDDADVSAAVNNGMWGAFTHNGQICMAAGRHLVHESVAEEYVRLLTERTAALKVGDPCADDAVRIGPLINERQVARVHGIVTATVAAGARARTGGTYDGPYYRPTVLSGVRPGMRAFDEEVFGPVAPVTTFTSDDEAVELANATEYGLSAAVQTRATGRGQALARRLRVGMAHVNGQPIGDAPHLPMGGMGASGNGGRYGGRWNLDEFTYWQWLSVRDEPLAYPI